MEVTDKNALRKELNDISDEIGLLDQRIYYLSRLVSDGKATYGDTVALESCRERHSVLSEKQNQLRRKIINMV